MSEMIKCSICGEEIEEDRSNSAWPINEGRCCGMCNARVMKARLPSARSLYEDLSSAGKIRIVWPISDRASTPQTQKTATRYL